MGESPPHVPEISPFIWGPNIPFPPQQAQARISASDRARIAFAQSYGATTSSNKRPRSKSPSPTHSSPSDDDEGTEESDLEDPYELEKPQRDEPVGEFGKELHETNVGMKMLLALGWTQGKGLGKDLQGRLEPVNPSSSTGLMGLGKLSQDTRMVSQTRFTAKKLDSERMMRETSEETRAREEKVAKSELVKKEIKGVLDKFRCDLCEKSYLTVKQYDEHTNSYDHHHKARALEFKRTQQEKKAATGEGDRRREKERKREAKELAKRMGVKVSTLLTPSTSSSPAPVSKLEMKAERPVGSGWKASGFASIAPSPSIASPIASTSTPSAPTAGGFKKVGWNTSSFSKSTPASTPSTSTSEQVANRMEEDEAPFVVNQEKKSGPIPIEAPLDKGAAPAFRSAGKMVLSDDEPRAESPLSSSSSAIVTTSSLQSVAQTTSQKFESGSGWTRVPPIASTSTAPIPPPREPPIPDQQPPPPPSSAYREPPPPPRDQSSWNARAPVSNDRRQDAYSNPDRFGQSFERVPIPDDRSPPFPPTHTRSPYGEQHYRSYQQEGQRDWGHYGPSSSQANYPPHQQWNGTTVYGDAQQYSLWSQDGRRPPPPPPRDASNGGWQQQQGYGQQQWDQRGWR